MPKPVKIKKAKSFMFTTKHHSFQGWMGVVCCIVSVGVLMSALYLSFVNKGASTVAVGGAALSALLLDFIGLLAGIYALKERDIHRWVPIASIAGNALMIAVWVLLVIAGA